MYNKAKRYSIPAYKEAKGMRGELIRKVVNYLHRVNDDTTILPSVTTHTLPSSRRTRLSRGNGARTGR